MYLFAFYNARFIKTLKLTVGRDVTYIILVGRYVPLFVLAFI